MSLEERELLHVVAEDEEGVVAEVFVYSDDTMLSLRRAVCSAAKLQHLALKFEGSHVAMHHTLQAAGLQNHSVVQITPIHEVGLASASSDGMVFFWDALSGKRVESLRGHSDAILGVSFSASGKLLATCSADCTGKVWETLTGKGLTTLLGHEDWVTCVAFDASEALAVTASLDCSARIWEVASGRCLQTLPGGVSPVFWASFAPEEEELATAGLSAQTDQKTSCIDKKFFKGADNTATIWSLTGQVQTVLEGHEDNVTCVTFSPDGLRLVTASQDRKAKLWEAAAGSCIRDFHGHTDTVQSALFSGDGRLVLTASLDRTAKVWESQTGDCLRTLVGHSGSVLFAAFSADGAFVATAARDATVRTWDTKTGRSRCLLEGHRAKVNAISFVAF
ncbi:unnamed protein product [Symbiodinium pilosum]|uniref:Uncharacterized protein n=1 Tax=Symbiodinium pilosum TaxID=2952 RepID=A0A812WG58_SYMPI|nr:unnamed protein product [Symbiodinium pilosum]